MGVNSQALNEHFGKTNPYDVSFHAEKLKEQFGINQLPEGSTFDQTLRLALKETRNEIEKFYLQVLLENGMRKYTLGVEQLENQMKFSVAGILSGEAGNA